MKKILLDENVANRIKEELISNENLDVKHINEVSKGLTDDEVYSLAKAEGRIIITGDDDFKDCSFKNKVPIIWMTPKARFDADIPEKICWIIDNMEKYNIKWDNAFVSITKDKYHIESKDLNRIFKKSKEKDIDFSKITKKMKL